MKGKKGSGGRETRGILFICKSVNQRNEGGLKLGFMSIM